MVWDGERDVRYPTVILGPVEKTPFRTRHFEMYFLMKITDFIEFRSNLGPIWQVSIGSGNDFVRNKR